MRLVGAKYRLSRGFLIERIDERLPSPRGHADERQAGADQLVPLGKNKVLEAYVLSDPWEKHRILRRKSGQTMASGLVAG